MQPLRLTLEGFGSYREPQEIDFEAVRLACITGANGAGKSTIFNGLSWALLGLTPTGDIDQLVSEGEPRATATLEFRHDGETYRISRSRSRGKNTSATLEHETPEGWVPIAEKGPRAVDAEISKMIGISKETYASTVLLAQGDSGRFAEADPGTRKKILGEILSLEVYSALAKDARERSSDTARRAQEASMRLGEIDQQLVDVEDVEARRTIAVARIGEIDKNVESIEDERRVAEREAAAGETASARLATLEMQIEEAKRVGFERKQELVRQEDLAKSRETRAAKRIAELNDLIASAETAQSHLVDLNARRVELEGLISSLDTQITATTEAGIAAKAEEEAQAAEAARLLVELEEEQERRKTLNHDESTCFTCGQGLDETLRHRIIADTENRIEALQRSIEDARTLSNAAAGRRDALRQELASLNGQKASLGTLADVDREIAQTESLVNSKPAFEDELLMVNHELVAAKDEVLIIQSQMGDNSDPVLIALIEEADGLAEIVANTLNVAHRADEARQKIAQLENERRSLSVDVGRYDERLAGFAKLAEERRRWDEIATASSLEADDFSRLAKAFGPDGVPNMIFTGVVDELERDASEMMERMTGGKFRLEFRTETTTKDGSARGALDVVIVTDTGERPYKSLSGGERFRVDLALRVALTRLLTRRSGSTIDFLALDEGWGALDPEGITAMLDELRELHDEFPLVLTITHTPEVAAAFEARFEVERDSDGTSVVHLVAA